MKIFPVILSGGTGKRLWPLSREQFPKQYQSLVGKYTLFQETILRLDGIENLSAPIIVCNSDHRFIVAEQLQQIKVSQSTILLEPVSRNTAPAIAAAAIHVMKDKENIDAILLILSADHVIQDIKAFHNAINIAQIQAETGKLATFGIVPTHSNTEYGYIQAETDNNSSLMHVKCFKEKPNIELADEYFKENTKLSSQNLPINWYWNSGMFMCQANTLIDELSLHANNIITTIKDAVINAQHDLDFIRLEEDAFASCSNISIDYALMEKSNKVIVVPLGAQWSDVGSWPTLYEIGDKDNNNNVIAYEMLSLLSEFSNESDITKAMSDIAYNRIEDKKIVYIRERIQNILYGQKNNIKLGLSNIYLGQNYFIIVDLLGHPVDKVTKRRFDNIYDFATFKIADQDFKLFFKNKILIDIERD